MAKIKDVYAKAWQKTKELKTLITFLIITNIVFLFFGQWMIATGVSGAVEFKKEFLKQLPEMGYLKPLSGPLAPYLSLKIAYTFLFNLIFGALLSTTAPGIIFFLPYIITVFRAWVIGVIFYGTTSTPIHYAIFYGTFILEFGGYVFSSAAGINIGLSLLNPTWKGKETRLEAFKAAVKDASLLFVIMATLLFLGAVWEMSWLHFFGLHVEKFIPLESSGS
ncbi:MAG: stage II sporulation protein M [Deltaproteobacteria bacterium]|nr:stage II sporulation protein M [Deltaproteobacteria bacterium]